MNHTLTLHRPVPARLWLALILGISLWISSVVSLAPALSRSAMAVSHASVTTTTHSMSADEHSKVCHCAHCSGGSTCCCRVSAGTCPTP